MKTKMAGQSFLINPATFGENRIQSSPSDSLKCVVTTNGNITQNFPGVYFPVASMDKQVFGSFTVEGFFSKSPEARSEGTIKPYLINSDCISFN